MRQIREVLRLYLQGGRSFAECGRALGISKSTAAKFVLLARTAGVDWGAAQQCRQPKNRQRRTNIVIARGAFIAKTNYF